MTEETGSTGQDALAARDSADDDLGAAVGPDAIRDGTPAVEEIPRCEACAQALPELERRGPGGKQRYCPPGQGGFEDTIGVTCREAGPHLKYVRQHFGTAAVADASLTVLGEHVTAVRAVLGPDGPIGMLTRALAAVDERLSGAVTDAIGRAERAEQIAREQTGLAETEKRLRGIAERQTTQAIAAEQQMERERNAAVDDKTKAQTARREAEKAQARAEGERDTQRERAERAEQQLEQAAARIRELEAATTELTTQVSTLTDQRNEANGRADQERDAAERARQEAREQIDAANTAAEDRIQRIRDAADATAAAARRELADQADRHTRAIQQLERERAEQLREHDQQLLAARTTLAQLRHTITTTLTRLLRDTTPRAGTEPAEATAHAGAALDALRQGAQDLLDTVAAEATTDPS